MATHTEHLKGVAAPLQGMAMALYFVLLPYVVLSKWSSAVRHGNGPLLRTLLVLLALFWLIFFVQVVLNVVRLRRGSSRGQGGSAWLAGLLVAVLPFLIPAVALSTHAPHAITQPIGALADRATARHQDGRAVPTRPGVPLSLSSLGSLPMALMAKRRSDLIRQHQFVEIEHDVDETIRVLRGLNPTLIAQLRQLIGDRVDGVIEVPHDLPHSSGVISADPVVACSLGDTGAATLVSFAREGGQLAILPTWSGDDVTDAVVSLHEDGWYLPLPKVNYFAPWRRGLCVTRWCCTWGHRATSTRSWPPAPSPSPRTSTRVDRSRHHGQRRRLPNPDERVTFASTFCAPTPRSSDSANRSRRRCDVGASRCWPTWHCTDTSPSLVIGCVPGYSRTPTSTPRCGRWPIPPASFVEALAPMLPVHGSTQ